ncbi:hypothetical protein CYMTET_30391, partial [Cymbomonas tetramitiformis]
APDSGELAPWQSWDSAEARGENEAPRNRRSFDLWPWGDKQAEEEEEAKEKVNLKGRASAVLASDRMTNSQQSVAVRYPDGGSYDGEWGNGRQHGQGLRVYANGDWCVFPLFPLKTTPTYGSYSSAACGSDRGLDAGDGPSLLFLLPSLPCDASWLWRRLPLSQE